MFLKKKLTVLATVSLLSASLLSGCSSSNTGDESTGGVATSAQVLANQSAREAIGQMIDKQALCDVILNNGSVPMNRYTPMSLAFDNGNDYADLTDGMGYEYNEEKAKEAWSKAKEEVGFDTVEIELVTSDSESGKRIGEFVQSELGDLEGLTISLTNVPFKQKLDKESKGDFDISFSSWIADFPDPLNYLSTVQTGNKFAKQTGYSNEEFDKLVNEAKLLPTTEAYEKYAQAEEMMLNDGYLLPLYQFNAAYIEKDYVSGIIGHSWGVDYTYKYADVAKEEKVLNLSSTSDIPSLDLSKATDLISFDVMNSTMEGLTRVDGDGKPMPGIAEYWETSEDGLTWTFNLRNDSVWSNGDPVTAHDFEYSWKRTLDPATGSSYTYIMEDIEGALEVAENGVDNIGVKAIDDYTLEVKLTRPVAYFAELMSFQVFFPQNQAFVEECGDRYGTGAEYQLYNGPFTLTTWKMEDQFTMTKNPTYWDASAVKLNAINTKIVKDSGAAINLYEDGQIDRAGLSADYVDKYKDSPEFKTMNRASIYMLQVNGANHSE